MAQKNPKPRIWVKNGQKPLKNPGFGWTLTKNTIKRGIFEKKGKQTLKKQGENGQKNPKTQDLGEKMAKNPQKTRILVKKRPKTLKKQGFWWMAKNTIKRGIFAQKWTNKNPKSDPPKTQ